MWESYLQRTVDSEEQEPDEEMKADGYIVPVENQSKEKKKKEALTPA